MSALSCLVEATVQTRGPEEKLHLLIKVVVLTVACYAQFLKVRVRNFRVFSAVDILYRNSCKLYCGLPLFNVNIVSGPALSEPPLVSLVCFKVV